MGEATERERHGVEVPLEQRGELDTTTPHEAYAAAILMYGSAVALVAAMGIALVWFAKWAL